VNRVFGEIGGVTAEESSLGVQGAAGEDPTGVGPPRAIMRGVGIAFLIGVLMVNTMSGYPEDGTALQREAATHGKEVFDPLGNAVAAMGQQAMIGDADTNVDREEVHDEEGGQILP